MIDLGTQSKIDPFCELDRTNMQFPKVLDWLSEPKIPCFKLFMYLKVQSTLCEKNYSVWILKKEICNRNSVKFGVN